MITKIDDSKEVSQIKKNFKEGGYFNGSRHEYSPTMIFHKRKLIEEDHGYEIFYSITSLKIKTVISHFGFNKHSFGIDTYRRYKHYTLSSNGVKYSISHNKERGVDIHVCEEDISKFDNPEEVYYNFYKELMQIQNPTLDINLYYPPYNEIKKSEF